MSDEVRTAVFGNVGSMISFRVSADDAPLLVKQFEPQFEVNDLVNMHNRHFIMSMIINGEKQPAFSASTLNLPEPPADYLDQIIDHSRRYYGRNRADVEHEIASVIKIPEQFDTPSRQRFQEKLHQPTGDNRGNNQLDLRKIRPSDHEPAPDGTDTSDSGYQRLNPKALSEIKSLFGAPNTNTGSSTGQNPAGTTAKKRPRRRPPHNKSKNQPK